jgi:hypothetical protein
MSLREGSKWRSQRDPKGLDRRREPGPKGHARITAATRSARPPKQPPRSPAPAALIYGDTAEVVNIWDRIPEERRPLARDVLESFTKKVGEA